MIDQTFDPQLIAIGEKAQVAANKLRQLKSAEKDFALQKMADALLTHSEDIIEANQKDLESGKRDGLATSFLERLTLSQERIENMANGLRNMASLKDPLMSVKEEWITEDDLRITKRPVPLGVIGIIYESRPNVTADATGLCLKAGNAVILRGGSDAINSNKAIVDVLRQALAETEVSEDAVQLIENTSHEVAGQLMKLNDFVDCLIPRGGAGLINRVVTQATVPVIETGVGNCHLYIHEAADLDKAKAILFNGKTQRNSVCNALESLVVDEALLDQLPDLLSEVIEAGVEVRGDEAVQSVISGASQATEEDYATEFLDSILAVKVVADYDEAVTHIEKYSTGHSEAIVSQDYSVAQKFLEQIDSAVVYVNASTRFSDGELFGFGGEIGISTQKLHARGPMGLEALTSYKYTVQGDGQIRG